MSHYVVVNHAEKRKKHKRKIRKALLALLLLIAIVFAVAFGVYRQSMTPTILEIAQVQVQSEATRAINEAIAAVFEHVDYKTLVCVEKNADNEITMLSANSAMVNILARNTSLLTQSKVNSLFQDDIEIPLGTLSGIPLLSERGPIVCVQVSPIGTVNCTFLSKFETAGINQTLHRIYVNVNSKIDLIVPTMHQTVEISTPILICETVIVGKVPDTFLQGNLFWNEV